MGYINGDSVKIKIVNLTGKDSSYMYVLFMWLDKYPKYQLVTITCTYISPFISERSFSNPKSQSYLIKISSHLWLELADATHSFKEVQHYKD